MTRPRLWYYLTLGAILWATAACAFTGKPHFRPSGDDAESAALDAAAADFYARIDGRDLEMQGNQEDIRHYFTDETVFYEFLDTMLPILRERKFLDQAVHTHAISGIDRGGEYATAQVDVTFYDTPYFYVLRKSAQAHQQWENADGQWRPGRVDARPLRWYEKIVKLP